MVEMDRRDDEGNTDKKLKRQNSYGSTGGGDKGAITLRSTSIRNNKSHAYNTIEHGSRVGTIYHLIIQVYIRIGTRLNIMRFPQYIGGDRTIFNYHR